jgi:hypothetical protein
LRRFGSTIEARLDQARHFQGASFPLPKESTKSFRTPPCASAFASAEWRGMSGGNLIAWVLLVATVVFQVFVTRRVRRCSLFDGEQKRAQTKLIWFVPIVGAAVVFGVVASEEEAMRPKREHRG